MSASFSNSLMTARVANVSPFLSFYYQAGPTSLFLLAGPTMRSQAPSLPLSLAALLLAHRWFDAVTSASATNITWLQPAAGDVYASGTDIVGQWLADDSVDNPSFRLCGYSPQDAEVENGDDDGSDDSEGVNDASCGSTVQPAVTQNADDGSYEVTM